MYFPIHKMQAEFEWVLLDDHQDTKRTKYYWLNMIFIKVVGQFPFFGIQIYIMHFFNCQIWKRTCYVQFHYFQKTHFGKILLLRKLAVWGRKHCLSSSFARMFACLRHSFINSESIIIPFSFCYGRFSITWSSCFCFVFILCTLCCQFLWIVIFLTAPSVFSNVYVPVSLVCHFWLLLRHFRTFISYKFHMNFPLHCSKPVQQIRHVEQLGNVCKYRFGINNTK